MKIQLEHITKTFKNTTAVNDLDLIIEDGELVCLLGPSGCGKSTTLSMLAGLLEPTSGEVYFDGASMSGVEAEKRDIGMVFQNYALYPHMTVEENIMFPLKMRWVPKTERKRRVKSIAEMMQITDLLSRKPGQLSGGQQQRVAIGRALIMRPALVLADEPTGNLDSRSSRDVMDLLCKASCHYQQTVLMITHNMNLTLSADRVFQVKDGELEELGNVGKGASPL